MDLKRPFVQRRLRFGPLTVQKVVPRPGTFPEALRHAHVRYLIGWAKRGGNVEMGTIGVPQGLHVSVLEPRVKESYRCCDRCGKKPKPRSVKRERDRRDWRVEKVSYAQVASGTFSRALWCRGCWRGDTLKWAPELDPHSPLYAGRSGRRNLTPWGNTGEATEQQATGERQMAMDKPEELPQFAKVEHVLELAGGKKDKMVKGTITTAPKPGEYGYDMNVSFGKTTLTFTVKPNSRNYRELFAEFGADEKKWVGKSIKVGVSEMTKGKFKGNDQVLIDPA